MSKNPRDRANIPDWELERLWKVERAREKELQKL